MWYGIESVPCSESPELSHPQTLRLAGLAWPCIQHCGYRQHHDLASSFLCPALKTGKGGKTLLTYSVPGDKYQHVTSGSPMMPCKRAEGHPPFPVFVQNAQEHMYQADGKEGGRHGSGQAGM